MPRVVACAATQIGHAALALPQDPHSDLLRYHQSAPCAANTRHILERSDQRAPYDRPFPAVNSAVGRVVATNLDPRPGSQRLKTVAEAKRFQAMPDSMALVVRPPCLGCLALLAHRPPCSCT